MNKDNSSLTFHSKGLGLSLDRDKSLPFKWSVANDSIIWIQWPDWDAAYNVRILTSKRLLLEVTEETEYDWLCFEKAIDQ
ncbi:hypothetical protein K6Y76_36875 [Burkholderia cenocepacia]|uniref:hypothetical protein n=1 Tax=Burkholderia cenocepacia TaxID=95486 RepID=UPI00222E1E76|nr:hypothetical protein [Burkholderia cenocepacia]MCW3528564.1 hypothetical protein [Burkholderia cenocepacia]MCW3618616.1 hypothetical protein [Burkholderia cenocepacia]MCW3656447.1 hypothetical protein [Burkholderia cenocepacia]MCW3671578.1 hypothetical protein [Burkholderia cenocepacia]MCW3686307.1 hypothetical protein [Burkholderia cenocepacia]